MAAKTTRLVQAGSDNDGRLWGWFVGIGATVAMLGMVASANLMLAAIAATYLVGALMFAGGILQIVHAFSVRRWNRIVLWMLSGVFYLAAAAVVLYQPVFAAGMLMLLLACLLGASGIMRVVYATGHRPKGWGWLCASGLISVAAAAIIAMSWPTNAVWMLGLVLAVDLLLQGTMLMLVGFSLKSAHI